ncbi:MAG: NUDIX domain-containing protein, partial [Anaerolineae bacterium]|nr:NUDIX domain-containing protein [Anaerolineae bacterium]
MASRRGPFPAEALLRWHRAYGRTPPWDQPPTPYQVWVAVVMYHQTRFATVEPYFRRFVACFPDPRALAEADLQEVLQVWEGLGYYRRAQYLHRAAQRIVEEFDGQVPGEWDALRSLPGVGAYTAGAILSIAFGQDVPAVDANVARVFARWYAVEEPVQSGPGRQRVWELAQAALPPGRAGAFNQALMDLGALVCRARAPRCPECPVGQGCLAWEQGRQEALPVRPPRRAVPHHEVVAAVLVRDGRVLLAQRRPEDMLGGMWEFPGGKREPGETLRECLRRELQEELGLRVRVGEELV